MGRKRQRQISGDRSRFSTSVNDLKSLNHKTVPYFSLDGLYKFAKVFKVYDGDSIEVILSINDRYFKMKCRLAGIDTPEIRSKDLIHKQMGYIARNALALQILDKVVHLNCGDFDKYGRLLITIFKDSSSTESVNDWLIDNEYANPYSGKTSKLGFNYESYPKT